VPIHARPRHVDQNRFLPRRRRAGGRHEAEADLGNGLAHPGFDPPDDLRQAQVLFQRWHDLSQQRRQGMTHRIQRRLERAIPERLERVSDDMGLQRSERSRRTRSFDEVLERDVQSDERAGPG
jgi:hypothetical protein